MINWLLSKFGYALRPISQETSANVPEESHVVQPTQQPQFTPLEPPHLPPSLANVVPRVAAIDPILAARYWKESLDFLDFNSIKKEQKQIFTIPADEMGQRGTSGEEGNSSTEACFVVLMLWEVSNNGKPKESGIRHPLICIGATKHEGDLFFPRTDVPPRLNEAYLEPGLKSFAFSLGLREEANVALFNAFSNIVDDKSIVLGWSNYWNLVLEYLQTISVVKTIDELEITLGEKASEVRGKKNTSTTWKLFAIALPASGSGTNNIEKIYSGLINDFDKLKPECKLYSQLCEPAKKTEIAVQELATVDSQIVGHIDEYESGKRALFPLDPSQRLAVTSILRLKHGEIQAINGPPGSGKTSMLRAVVASIWVQAALKGEPCPIIVACGATNQSVTNVIGAFGSAPHPDINMAYAKRWIDGASSYGAYLPSASVRNDKDKKEELGRLVCLKSVKNGFLYEYWNRENILLPTKAVSFESTYINYAKKALPTAVITKVEEAVNEVWKVLDLLERERRQFKTAINTQSNWLKLAESYLEDRAKFWSDDRMEVAANCVNKLKENPANLQAAEEFMDITWRAECFHWAARYWEGKFLLAQRERLLSKHPKNVEEALRRLCMLTPCLVSTLHTVPQFAEIESESSDSAGVRVHSFGLFDFLIIDEAGQALPELGAAVFALAKRAAVVGDLMQLAPIPANTALTEKAIASRAGVLPDLEGIVRAQRSIASGSVLGMARLVSRRRDTDDDGITLRYHYRCKPSIIEYCNLLCYANTLIPRTDEAKPYPELALGWVEVDSIPSRVGGSLRNIKEANEIVDWILERWPVWSRAPQTKQQPIHKIVAIVTPYCAQSNYLEKRLQERVAELREQSPENWPSESDIKKMTIGTVHRLQGAERPIVCFSLVEGPEQAEGSFVDRDGSMLNVAVSRAKSSFIIFANQGRLFVETRTAPDEKITPSHLLGQYLRSQIGAKRLYPNQLVIIEAGGKLSAITKILGKESTTLATGGALYNLPLVGGVDIEAGFVPHPQLEEGASVFRSKAEAILNKLANVVVATDDDRMGEYIAWQVGRLLGESLAKKNIKRARIGSITKTAVEQAICDANELHEGKVLAEIVREVIDCIISQKFYSISKNPNIVADVSKLDMALYQIGALTGNPNHVQLPRPKPVGRVQAAILRLLLNEARHVASLIKEKTLVMTFSFGETTISGHVFKFDTLKETTNEENAVSWVNESRTFDLEVASIPVIDRLRIDAPTASTVTLLAQAWAQHAIRPWDALHSLQSLYDGSWSHSSDHHLDPVDPILPHKPGVGHPPVTPTDRADTPERLQRTMNSNDHKMYSLVWDYFEASENKEIFEEYMTADFRVKNSNGLGIRFIGYSYSGIPEKLDYIFSNQFSENPRQSFKQLQNGLSIIATAPPALSYEPAAQWSMGPDRLLWEMERLQIGRPSTYAHALKSLHEKGLIQFPAKQGPLQITEAGLATALILEEFEPFLSSPAFSGELSDQLLHIEEGRQGPKEVLGNLLQALVPEEKISSIEPKIWNSLGELESLLDSSKNNSTSQTQIRIAESVNYVGSHTDL